MNGQRKVTTTKKEKSLVFEKRESIRFSHRCLDFRIMMTLDTTGSPCRSYVVRSESPTQMLAEPM